METPNTFLTQWYYSLPNFALAAIMYTIIGRVMLSFFFDDNSKNYIWRFFVRVTEPFLNLIALVTPKATAPVVLWLFGFVWLFWLRVLMLYLYLILGLLPPLGAR